MCQWLLQQLYNFLSRPINLNLRASPAAFTVTRRHEMVPQTLHLRTRCSAGQTTVPSADMGTTPLITRPKSLMQLEERMGPVVLPRKTLTTVSTAQSQLMSLRTSPQRETQQMIGRNTSAPLGKNTITTVEPRFRSGRSPKTCWRGNKSKKTRPWQTAFLETWTTDKRPYRTKVHQSLVAISPPHQPTLDIPLLLKVWAALLPLLLYRRPHLCPRCSWPSPRLSSRTLHSSISYSCRWTMGAWTGQSLMRSWPLPSPKLPCGLCFISSSLLDLLSTSLLCSQPLSTPTKFQRRTPDSLQSLWHQTLPHHRLMSHRAIALHRAIRNLPWVHLLEPSHLRKIEVLCLQVNQEQFCHRWRRNVLKIPELFSKEIKTFFAQDQTYPLLHRLTFLLVRLQLTPPAPTPPPWQLILMRALSNTSKDGLQKTQRNRRRGCERTFTTWAACTCPNSARRWKTCARSSACVRSRPRSENRESCFWGSKARS